MRVYLIKSNKYPDFVCAFTDPNQADRFIENSPHLGEELSIEESVLCLTDYRIEDCNEVARSGELIFIYHFPGYFTRASRFLDEVRNSGLGCSGKGDAYVIDLIHPEAPLPDINGRGEFIANFGPWDARHDKKWLKYYSEGYVERNFLTGR